jgi:hypothetical protein
MNRESLKAFAKAGLDFAVGLLALICWFLVLWALEMKR